MLGAMKAEKVPAALADMIEGFGDRLRAGRLAFGVREQSTFAKMLGVSASRYNLWEQNKHPPPAHYLALLKKNYGIGADWVLSGDYGALSARVFQAMITLGAAPDAPDSARELRRAFPDIPDPGAKHRRTLHERVQPPPSRLLGHFEGPE